MRFSVYTGWGKKFPPFQSAIKSYQNDTSRFCFRQKFLTVLGFRVLHFQIDAPNLSGLHLRNTAKISVSSWGDMGNGSVYGMDTEEMPSFDQGIRILEHEENTKPLLLSES